jgi:chloride channel 3/4/5
MMLTHASVFWGTRFGIKLPAGIFIPTLAVGACVGRIVGLGIEYAFALHPDSALFGFCAANGPLPAPFGQACVLPGVYSMVGAAAALAGVTRTTVSLAVIMFEVRAVPQRLLRW